MTEAEPCGCASDKFSNQVQQFERFSGNKSCGVPKCKIFFGPAFIVAGFFIAGQLLFYFGAGASPG